MKEKILEIGRDSTWYLLSNILSALIGFIAIPIFTRVFTPGEYGIYSLISAAVVLISPVLHVWLSTSAVRFYAEYDNKGELEVYYSTLLFYIPHFLIFVLAVLLPITIFVLPLGKYRLVISLAIAILALFSVFNILLNILRAKQMSWQYSLLLLVVQFFRYIVGAAITVWFHTGIAGPFIGWLGILIICLPIELIMLKTWRYFDRKLFSKKLLKVFFNFGFFLILSTFFNEVLAASDQYLIQWIKGSYQVGLYSFVYALITQVEGLVYRFLQTATAPIIMKVYEREGEKDTIELISKVTRYFLFFMVPTTIGFYALREPLIDVIASSKYLPSESVVLPIALGIFLFNLSWIPALAFFIKKNTKLTLVPLGGGAILNVCLNLVMIPKWGYAGAAWATLISYAVSFTTMTIMGYKHLEWKFPWLAFTKICIATFAMWLALLGLMRLPLEGLTGLIVQVLIGTIVYLIILFIIRFFSKAELAFTLEMLVRIPGINRIRRPKNK